MFVLKDDEIMYVPKYIHNQFKMKQACDDFIEKELKMFDEEYLKKRIKYKWHANTFIGILFVYLLIAGCDNSCTHINDSKHQEKIEYLKTNSIYQYKIVCIDGKEYIEGASRLANNLDFNGKPISCEVK